MPDIKNADELFKDFKAQSVSEFFKKNAAMLGYTGSMHVRRQASSQRYSYA